MTDLDRILGQGLRKATEHIGEPSTKERAHALAPLTPSSTPDPARRPRVLALVAALVALAAIGGTVVLTRTSDDEPARVTTAPTVRTLADAGPGWHQLETGSVPPMSFPALVWTGKELVVAGQSAEGFEVHSYQPDTEVWRRLPDPPIDVIESVGMVWTGAEVVMVDGALPAASAAAWSPSEDTWQDLGDPPAAAAVIDSGSRGIRPGPTQPGPALVWTGERVLDLTHGAVWDPATGDWASLSLPNQIVDYSALLSTNPVWDGTEVVATAWATQPGLAWNATGSTHRLVAPLPASIATPGYVVPAVATESDGRILLVSGTEQGSVASLDARTGEWRREADLAGMSTMNGCPRQAANVDGQPVAQPCSGEAPVWLGADGWVSTAPAPVGDNYNGTWIEADGVLVTWEADWTDADPPTMDVNYWVPPGAAEPTQAPETATGCPELPGGTAAGPGWYVPVGLPEGWSVERAVSQAADGLGEAQLWLRTPTGNDVVVTLKVPSVEPWRSTALLHPLAGQDFQVCVLGSSGDPATGLRGVWPGTHLIANWLDRPADPEAKATSINLAELETAVTALRPADTETWRAFLADVDSVDEALLVAEDLDDLPDET